MKHLYFKSNNRKMVWFENRSSNLQKTTINIKFLLNLQFLLTNKNNCGCKGKDQKVKIN